MRDADQRPDKRPDQSPQHRPDRRRWPANAHVAASRLRGQARAETYSDGTPAQVVVPVADLCASPGGTRDRQLLLGAQVTVYDTRDGWSFVEALQDGYTGYLTEASLGPQTTATHVITARASHAYTAADLKTPDRAALSMGSALAVTGWHNGFAETDLGFVPGQHVTPLGATLRDPVTLAEGLLGTPYLWGGNSAFGIDCSGLVQLPLQMLGHDCPGDSDMQASELGVPLEDGAPLKRGDLLFWRGHVAWVADPTRILHANAGSMSTAFEDLQGAIARIAAAGDGPITARRRLPFL
ncbi:peptidoglycan endopeptidase [Pseudooceanicola sediminis]|uniref:Peptidoglycan endopeptidase n=1 Tax=Pseudooceanicola sediminis TaxID=2211117 RepID=A0A399IWX1_9RHOB|nr:NlpC/P60 family protein [Pseudooceanicola sediminis]KAA2312512.1 NlpC/P60 family protein [Puniceibacterium sp. HSS470]RII37521.1 peptidoglycan endopeptidase [Pseudooceanicola sediminis]|tara:strand:- start:72025 stop:72912 length:888 start_codon:yes stop_codon:yes gene_type:complete